MTKRIDPEIKSLRAIRRALDPLDTKTRKRALEYTVAREASLPWVNLPIRVEEQTKGKT